MLSSGFDTHAKAFLRGLKPDPLLLVSEWAEKHRMLSSVASAEPGPWRNKRTPYLVEIMDELSPANRTQVVVFMKGAQIGATECGNNWIGYVIDVAPGPMLAVMPSIDTAKRNSRTRIAPLIEQSPRLKEKIASKKYKDSGNTQLSKEFLGGVLVMTGANSASALRSMPVKDLLLDEIDGYPLDVDGEGDPVELAEARTRTFRNKKIFKISTPTEELTSRISQEFEASDQRYYHVPCPHCNKKQKLVWANVKWDKGKEREAYYVCDHCGSIIEEYHKTWMLENGVWIAENPGASGGLVAGFHLSSLYSPLGWFSWGDAALQFKKAKKDNTKLKAFVNTVLGETWKEKSEVPDWKRLYEYRELYSEKTVPMNAFMLTAGVDIQRDRIEMQVRGWGRDKENWLVDYLVFEGDTSQDEVWDELKKAILDSYPHEGGRDLPIKLTAIDSGYNTQTVYEFCRKFTKNKVIAIIYNTQTVYEFCRKFTKNKVIAIKGQDNATLPISAPKTVDVNIKSGKRIRRGAKVYSVGVSILKQEIYSWLRQVKPTEEGADYPGGFCHHYQVDEDFFKQLTAERMVEKKNTKGYTKWEWEKIRERNEVLDTFVYARAAASALKLDRMKLEDFISLERELGVVKVVQTKKEETSAKTEKSENFRKTKTERKRKRKSSIW